MSYSSGIFSQNDNLAQAQHNKYQRIINEINPQGQHILEIGCGWGGFIKQATEKGFSVKGLTLSHEQKAYSEQLINKQGSDAYIALQDYRHEKKQIRQHRLY